MNSKRVNQQIIVFRVGPVVCSVAAHLVDAIVSPKPLHQFPRQADYIIGVLEYGKTAVSIVNLFQKFNLPNPGVDCETRYVMGFTSKGVSGFWVDEIMEVTDEYEVHNAQPPTFTNVNIFDCTYLWRDKLVLNTDFDRLFNMKESLPIKDWIEADGANAIASTYPNSTIEDSDIVAWSEPVDERSEKQISDLMSRGNEFSQPIAKVDVTEQVESDSSSNIFELTADKKPSIKNGAELRKDDALESITVSPLTEIGDSTVIELESECVPEPVSKPKPRSSSILEEENDPIEPFSVVDDSELENEILASIAKSHGDIMISDITDTEIESLDDLLAETTDIEANKKYTNVTSDTVTLVEKQEELTEKEGVVQSFINRDFATTVDNESVLEEKLDLISESLDLLEAENSRQIELNLEDNGNNAVADHIDEAEINTPIKEDTESELESSIISEIAAIDDEVRNEHILETDKQLAFESKKHVEVENFNFKEKIKNKIVVYPSSANYVKTPNPGGVDNQKVIAISSSQSGGKSAYSPELSDENESVYLPLEKVAPLVLGDKRNNENYQEGKRKRVTQIRAIECVVQRISDKRVKTAPTSRLRLLFAILISAIIVFFIQHYWLNSHVEATIDIPTLELLPKTADKLAENVSVNIETVIDKFGKEYSVLYASKDNPQLVAGISEKTSIALGGVNGRNLVSNENVDSVFNWKKHTMENGDTLWKLSVNLFKEPFRYPELP